MRRARLVKIALATLLTSSLVVLPPSLVDAVGPDVVEDFEGVAVGSDPVGWVDTGANNSMAVNDSLFKVTAVDGSQVLGTTSTATNIHSHYVGGVWASAGGYTYSGRMRMSSQSAGIGVTVLSDYNQSDSYYRLRRSGSTGSFVVSPHGTSMSGGVLDSRVVPVANVWYEFKVEAVDTGARTEIRAKVWQQGSAEPAGWQIDAYDASATRRTTGTVGVWSHSTGSKFWDDLTVETLAEPGPHALAVSSSGSGVVSVDPVSADYEHGTSVTLTATPAAGWGFVRWSGDLAGSQNPATVVVEADTVIEAVFAEQVEVATSTVGSGSVAVDPAKATYLAGESVTLTATPDPGWQFVGWSGGLSGSSNPTTATLTADTVITATFQELPDAGSSEDFEGVAVGSDPVGWVDTGANNSMAVDDSLFKVTAVDGSQVLGTASTATNIHSHQVGGVWASAGGYTYSGRMRMSSQSAGIGVTVLSDYNQSDSYYRLRRSGSSGTFALSPHGTSMSGGVLDSRVVPVANVWYEFKVEAVDTGARTEIRAKVWQQGSAEPAGWQIDAYDASATRRTTGTVGVWSHSTGSKFWDDLTVQAEVSPPPAPSRELLAFEIDRLVTRADRGFPWNQPPMASANGDWTTPINYAGGRLHFRAEIKEGGQPVPQSMQLQFCVWQDSLTKETCSTRKSIVGNPGNVVEWSDEISRMWKKNNVPIDWTRPRQRYGIAIWNARNGNVSDFGGLNWSGENPDQWYPLDLQFTVVAVPAGESFGGWDAYTD